MLLISAAAAAARMHGYLHRIMSLLSKWCQIIFFEHLPGYEVYVRNPGTAMTVFF